MGTFRPKEVFEQAQKDEAQGNVRVAATHYASLGLYLRRKGKLREARKLLLKAIQLHPSSARLYLHLASVEAGQGSESSALTSMRAFCTTASVRGKLQEYEKQVLELMEKHPSLVSVFYAKWLETERGEPRLFIAAAQALEKAEEAAAALVHLRDAFELADQDPRVRSAIRRFLERQLDTIRLHSWESYESGRLSKEQMLGVLSGEVVTTEADPVRAKIDASFTLDKSLSSMIASLEEELGETGLPTEDKDLSDLQPLVLEFRRQASDVLRDDAGGRWDMAHALSEMGLFSDAMEELKQIPTQSEWHSRSMLKQAEIYSATEDYLGALECLQKVLRQEPKNSGFHAEALYQMAWTYFHLTDMDAAIRKLEALEKIVGVYRDSKTLRMRIEEARVKARTGT